MNQKEFDVFVNAITQLRREIAELKAQPRLKYAGVWLEGERYSEGNLVTRNGGLWLAERSQPDTPGAADSGWRLIVKSGRA